eukprot:jgi/Tetstr1/455360/TSEL_042194.t1
MHRSRPRQKTGVRTLTAPVGDDPLGSGRASGGRRVDSRAEVARAPTPPPAPRSGRAEREASATISRVSAAVQTPIGHGAWCGHVDRGDPTPPAADMSGLDLGVSAKHPRLTLPVSMESMSSPVSSQDGLMSPSLLQPACQLPSPAASQTASPSTCGAASGECAGSPFMLTPRSAHRDSSEAARMTAQLEAIEAECKRVGELLQTERSAHRETSLLLKEMAIQHMDEQRQKLDLRELLRIEQAARSTKPREAESMLQAEVERRSQLYLDLHREHMALQLQMESQLGERKALAEAQATEVADLQDKLVSEARRTKTAERAAERVKEKLQVAYREVECSKLRVSAVEQAKDAALEQALAARTEASAVGASKQELAQQLSEAQELLAQSRAADRVRSEETSTAAAAGAELQAAHEELEALKVSLAAKEDEAAKLASEVQTTRQEMAEQLAVQSAQVQESTSQVTQLEAELSTLRSQAQLHADSATQLGASLSAALLENSDLQEQLSALWAGHMDAVSKGSRLSVVEASQQ